MLFHEKGCIKKLTSKLGEHNKYSFLPAKKQTDKILTNIIPLGGTMKKLAILIVAVLVLGLTSVLMAADATSVDGTAQVVTGAVPWVAEWTIANGLDPFGTTAIADYTAGHVEKTALITVSAFSSNDSAYVKIEKAHWSALPANYAGAKTSTGDPGDSDLLIKVATAELFVAGTGNPGLSNLQTTYAALPSAGAAVNLVQGGDVDSGFEAAGFVLDCKVLMDWVTDIVGTYTTTLTLTCVHGLP